MEKHYTVSKKQTNKQTKKHLELTVVQIMNSLLKYGKSLGHSGMI